MKVIWKTIRLKILNRVFGIGYSSFYNGCAVESTVAQRYDIPYKFVDMKELMPDAYEIETEWYKNNYEKE